MFKKKTTPTTSKEKAPPKMDTTTKPQILEGKKTFIVTLFGVISSVLAILQGNASLPEILKVLGDIVNLLGFNADNSGPAAVGFLAIAATRMSIGKLISIMQELWPIIQEVRKLAMQANQTIQKNK